ncbi:hypothetical protein [Planktothricoides sp. SR001]|uniref:hypothetical protein n=1 Tax=Planktothricoides sp. SR001 TaxID=1705388 RepID=UPI0012E2FC06|nr:hypothetical protein [Planktothricoides sp. SR001]
MNAFPHLCYRFIPNISMLWQSKGEAFPHLCYRFIPNTSTGMLRPYSPTALQPLVRLQLGI